MRRAYVGMFVHLKAALDKEDKNKLVKWISDIKILTKDQTRKSGSGRKEEKRKNCNK